MEMSQKEKQTKVKNSEFSAEQRREVGLRLRQLRAFCGMDRGEFGARYGFALLTLRDWELAKRNSIPARKAEYLAENLRKDGVVLNFHWLLYGIGCEPMRLNPERAKTISREPKALDIQMQEEKQINDELVIFMSGHSDAIVHVIADEAMAPFYHRGDMVAGIELKSQDSEFHLGEDCIVITKDNQMLFRRLQRGHQLGLFTLSSINPHLGQDALLFDVELKTIAPAIWVRRRNASNGAFQPNYAMNSK